MDKKEEKLNLKIYFQVLHFRGAASNGVSTHARDHLQGPKTRECSSERGGPHHAL